MSNIEHPIVVELRPIENPDAQGVSVRELEFSESYNTGWGGTVTLGAHSDLNPTPGAILSAMVSIGIEPGKVAVLELGYDEDSNGRIDTPVRRWPCRISSIRPYEFEGHVFCRIGLVDPISAIAHRPVWSAYRSTSAVDVVGGVLSAAAGGDGRSTCVPVLDGGPSLRVRASYRARLQDLPYVLAVGTTFGQWLATFAGMLGLRCELSSVHDSVIMMGESDSNPDQDSCAEHAASDDPNGCLLTLTDMLPQAPSLYMATPDPETGETEESEHGKLTITAESAWPATTIRGGLVDDPVDGRARPIFASGGIGTVISAPEVDMDEAATRMRQALFGTIAEMHLLSATGRQPLLGPGRVVCIAPAPHTRDHWQVASATHTLTGACYSSRVTLLRADVGWFPPTPLRQPPVFVSAIVSESSDVVTHEPVPRDRLGRIHVWFPFSPRLAGDDALLLLETDSNEDARIRLEDFNADQIAKFEGLPDSTEFVGCDTWDECVAALERGDYDDPYPGKSDAELTEAELAEREAFRSKRITILQYSSYLEAKALDEADRDRDGVVSERDDLVSSALEAALRDDGERETLRQEWDNAVTKGTVGDLDPEEDDDALILEYGKLLGDADDAGLDSTTDEEIIEARADADYQQIPRWPPKVPLPVVEPMAGALHGFITGHRQGDVCRVAVQDPFTAEIIGFQYRDNRKINASLNDALSGLVVEHAGPAWSGLVFRRTSDLQT